MSKLVEPEYGTPEHAALVDLARRVQRWSIRRYSRLHRAAGKGEHGNFGEAARALKVTVDQVSAAVQWHPWMFTMDSDWPLPIRRIEHEGE